MSFNRETRIEQQSGEEDVIRYKVKRDCGSRGNNNAHMWDNMKGKYTQTRVNMWDTIFHCFLLLAADSHVSVL